MTRENATIVQARSYFVAGVGAYLCCLSGRGLQGGRGLGPQPDLQPSFDAAFQAGVAWARGRYGVGAEIVAAAQAYAEQGRKEKQA